ncbi:MAG: bifunctional DNA-binding transcriptional regulator/O6-methylguanine-DNA methyltransferase Ada [Acidobacteriaceae bacterium]|nr:bifunctional DNA-binding transcriptional regulator/O6-methylguanine-DNA methyltransferase Ada [Acidobacteriaceae bacterium]MBV9501230.1 bifunctional DNA-binding transcriptional regulator/O6-methylguanine-DNA methyltransferase Ada [Acidobacteriaceae bacterium]
MLRQDLCWQAVTKRDHAQDGRFYFGVVTTGVYCNPSCPARRAKRENVRFYETPEAAEHDGLRACLRCRPGTQPGDDPRAKRIQAVVEYIEHHSQGKLTLDSLARIAGLSPFHLQRKFKASVGVSPRQYLDACRLRAFKSELRSGEGLLESVWAAGFGSTSRVYERGGSKLGLTPSQYRSGAEAVEISYLTMSTRLDLLMIAATDRGLCFVQFGENEAAMEEALRKEYPKASLRRVRETEAGQLQAWAGTIRDYLNGKQPDLSLPADIRATAFQTRVWNFLRSIPSGEVRSYAAVAAGMGQPQAVRAVASACARNPVALLIPCHRVIRGTGDPGGYRWGLERKQALLEMERERAAPNRG